MYTIGIDIGGMSIKGGVVDENGVILATDRVETLRNAEKDLNNIVSLVNGLLSKMKITIKDVKGVGIGCPGALNSESGIVEVLPNLNWYNVEIVKILSGLLNTEVRITNDANAAALAEYKFGAAKNYGSCVMFTLGTGVGGAYIENGKILEGYLGKGSELGHATLVLDGIPCSCGRNGCIERYVSATALIEQTKAAMLNDKSSLLWKVVSGDIDKVEGRTVFTAVKEGDKTAESVLNTYIKYLSESMMTMMNIFRPQAFILGGGVSAAGKVLIDGIKNYCKKFYFGYKDAPIPDILIATLGNDAGIIGAASLL